jgi:hypothetical protein
MDNSYIFDVLCQIAEQGLLPERIARLLESASLFEFPGRAHEILPQIDFEHNQRSFFQELFFLPFPAVVMEDSASCVLLADYNTDAIGIEQERFFLECQVLNAAHLTEFAKTGERSKVLELHGCAFVNWGKLMNTRWFGGEQDIAPEERSGWRRRLAGWWPWFKRKKQHPSTSEPFSLAADVRCLGSLVARRGRREWSRVTSFDTESLREAVGLSGTNALVALKEVAVFNLPKRFIVRRTRNCRQPLAAKHHILRSLERPIYILLEPREFRERIGVALSSDAKTTDERRDSRAQRGR